MTNTDKATTVTVEINDLYGAATPEQITAALDSGEVTYRDDLPLPEDIPPPLAPGEEIMVPVTFRVTTSDYYRIKALAEKRGEKYTVMVRNWVEAELAEAERDAEHPLTREDRLKALDLLRKLLDQPEAAAA